MKDAFGEVTQEQDAFGEVPRDAFGIIEPDTSKSSIANMWANPSIDLLTGEPIPIDVKTPKLNPIFKKYELKKQYNLEKEKTIQKIIDTKYWNNIEKGRLPKVFDTYTDKQKAESILSLISKKQNTSGELETPFFDPVVDIPIAIATGGTGLGFKQGVKSGMKALGKDVVSAVTMSGSDLAEGVIKGVGKKLTHADEVKQFGEFINKHLDTPMPEIKLPVAEKVEDLTKAMPDDFAGNINLKRMNISDEAKDFAKEIFDKKRGVVTHKDVIETADEVKAIRKALTDEEIRDIEASFLKTRQHAAKLLNEDKLTKETIDALNAVSSNASLAGRLLGSYNITVEPILDSAKGRIVQKLSQLGIDVDEIVKASQGIDWNNSKQVTEFYRKFVKPTKGEILKEIRYINMLSSPKTHIINATTNAVQALVVRPTAKAMEAGIDAVNSAIKGKARERFFKEIPAYYKGVIGSSGESFKQALNILRGKESIFRPDLDYIPTNVKALKLFQGIPRALEASDIFFRNMITQGEAQALIKRGVPKDKAIVNASKKAEEIIFRKKIDPSNKTGQGDLLSYIDKLTNVMYNARRHRGVDWFIPFVETPMNIFKQGIEYSPLGVATLKGNTDKIGQLAKTATGSIVFGTAAYKAFQGDVTWSVPKNKVDRQLWEARGIKPYSIKLGDNWYSLSRLGPLAYPFAMAAALKYYMEDSPSELVDSNAQKVGKTIAGIGRFFADQSYVDGIGNIVDLAQGDEGAITKQIGSLAGQMIPLNGLRTWTGRIIDDIKRKPDSEFSVDALINNLMMNDPYFSKYTKPFVGYGMQPVKNEFKIQNAFSPVEISKENKDWTDAYKGKMEMNKWNTLMNKNKKKSEDAAIENAIGQ